MVPTVGLDLQGLSVEICEEERGEEKGSSEREALDSVTAVLVTHAVVHHHRVSASPGEAISVLQTLRVWYPATAPDYSHLILDNLDRLPADVGRVPRVVVLQGQVGHTVILLITVDQLGGVVVEGVGTVPVVVAVAGEALYSRGGARQCQHHQRGQQGSHLVADSGGSHGRPASLWLWLRW